MIPVDTFYVFGRRQWADGMCLETSATVVVTHDDGALVFEVDHEDGSGGVLVFPAELAAAARALHEMIFCGCELLEHAAAG